jgi:NADH:ubiquinone oxidoreductase subunit 6 (subunit J)
MLTILLLLIGVVAVLVLALLAVVVVGIKQEPATEQMTSRAPSAIAAWVRHLLGVYVRRPDLPSPLAEDTENRA